MHGWMDIEIETQMITCFWACKSISHRDRPMTGCIRHANPILRASSVLSKHVNVLRLVGASKAYSEYFGFSSKQWAIYGARITGVHLPKQWFLISRWRCGFKSHSWQVCFDKVPIAEQIKDYLISPKQVLYRFFNSSKHHERQRAMKQWWSTGEGEHTEAKSAWIKSKLFARCCRREQCFRALCVCVDGHFGNSLHTSFLMSSHKPYTLALGADSGIHCQKVGIHIRSAVNWRTHTLFTQWLTPLGINPTLGRENLEETFTGTWRP